MDEGSYKQVLEQHTRAGGHPFRAAILVLLVGAALAFVHGASQPERSLESWIMQFAPYRE
jgi:hypothetical protein